MLRVLTLGMIIFGSFKLDAATLKVGKNQAYKTIASAISAAKNGDKILIEKGIYKEHNLDITKSIQLLGIDNPVIDGEEKYELLFVHANDVTISGITFKNTGSSNLTDMAAIKMEGVKNCAVINCKLENNYFGIYLAHAKGCLIKDNILRGNFKEESVSGNGIHFWKSDSNFIENNDVSGHRDGIYFEFVTNTFIRKNNSHKNQRYGLHFMFSDGNTYEQNHFHENGSGVAVMYTKNIRMVNNIFEFNWGGASYGLLLKEISRSVITGNTFIRNTTGIVLEESSDIHIYNNIFRSNGTGLRLSSSSTEDTITTNNFIGNTFDVTSNGSINTNYFSRNFWDKYRGYDLDKNKVGDVPYRPVSLFSMLMEQIPNSVMLLRSVVSDILDQVEKVFPDVIPESLIDNEPVMKSYAL